MRSYAGWRRRRTTRRGTARAARRRAAGATPSCRPLGLGTPVGRAGRVSPARRATRPPTQRPRQRHPGGHRPGQVADRRVAASVASRASAAASAGSATARAIRGRRGPTYALPTRWCATQRRGRDPGQAGQRLDGRRDARRGRRRGAGGDPARPGSCSRTSSYCSLTSPTPKTSRCRNPPAEAHDGPVGVEHPLVLPDRRPHHLDEVARRQLLGAPGHQRADLRRLLAAELGVLERRDRPVRPPPGPRDSRMLSNRWAPTATRTAARAGPAARSIAGRIAVASICRVRSPRGPSSRKSPIRSRVITSSAMMPA